MTPELKPVRERLARLQKNNYRSLSCKEQEKTVKDEIEEFKKSDLIKSVSMFPKGKITEVSEIVSDEEAKKLEVAEKNEEDDVIKSIEFKISAIETKKADMMREGNFVLRLYDIKKIEKEILPLLYDAKSKGIELPEKLKERLAMAAPNASLVE